MAARYKHAFRCAKCPQRGDELGCPAWTEYVERNPATGEERLTKECVYRALPKLLIHALAASNQAAASVESHRNEIIRAVAGAVILEPPGRAAVPIPVLPEPGEGR